MNPTLTLIALFLITIVFTGCDQKAGAGAEATPPPAGVGSGDRVGTGTNSSGGTDSASK